MKERNKGYYCKRCNHCHYLYSGKGKRHKKYMDEEKGFVEIEAK